MDLTYVIKRPLLTEKSTWGSNEQNRYAFEVDMRATKKDIKAAVESLFKVKVEKINTQVRTGRDRQYKYGMIPAKLRKHAIVRVAEGQKIEMF